MIRATSGRPAGRRSLGADRAVLKTLMTEIDGKPVCVILASDREVA